MFTSFVMDEWTDRQVENIMYSASRLAEGGIRILLHNSLYSDW